MDFFNKFFDAKPNNKNKNKDDYMYMDMLSGEIPIYSQYGNNIFASDVVQQSISCIVQEIIKLNPMHVIMNGTQAVPKDDNIQNILRNPNKLMTGSELLEKTTWQLFLNKNSFIYPMFDDKERLIGLYPLNPDEVTFLKTLNNDIYVKFHFPNNTEETLPYDKIIHERLDFSVNDLMGGDAQGQPNSEAILETVKLNDTLLKGVAKAMKANFAVNGILEYHGLIDDEKMQKRIDAFNAKIARNEAGIIPLDMEVNYSPIKKDFSFIDEKLLRFIDEKVLRNFGVPLSILTGDYTKPQYEAFYQKTIEPLVKKKSEAYTKGIFSQTEINGYKHRINFYTKDLTFMSMQETIEWGQFLGNIGGASLNEIRGFVGLAPLAELDGVIKQSLNYVDVDIAQKYQLKDSKYDVPDNGGDE